MYIGAKIFFGARWNSSTGGESPRAGSGWQNL